MPNPTTNPTRLSRTARDVAWNTLPGDALRFPSGHLTTMSSSKAGEEYFRGCLTGAPVGSTILPYRAERLNSLDLNLLKIFLGNLQKRKMPSIVVFPEMLDRALHNGQVHLDGGLLDFTADLPEAPFVHHAANILHCMVKFGAPAFVAAKPARDPRNNPQPGDVRITGDGRTWTWGLRPISWDFWRSQNHNSSVRWECGDATAPAKAPVIPNYFAKYGPWPVVSGPPEGRPFGQNVHVGGVVDLGRLNHIIAECTAALRSDGDARRCPRTDPRPGDICILTNDEVEVFTDGTSKEVWRIGGPRIRWIRVEDVVRG